MSEEVQDFGATIEHSGWAAKFVTLEEGGFAGPGWYVWDSEYPEEGADFYETEEEARKFMMENPITDTE